MRHFNLRHSYLWVLAVLVMAAMLGACSQASAKSPPKEAPYHIEKGPDSVRVVLTPRAAERLSIQTEPIYEETVVRTRTVAGQVIADMSGGKSASPGGLLVEVVLIESDLREVDRSQAIRVLPLDDQDGNEDEDLIGEPIEDPDANDSAEPTAALHFTIDNPNPRLTVGERVLVEIPLLGGGLRKIIPYTAVIYDLHGETFAYTRPVPLVYVRQPITVEYIDGEQAILLEAPPVGVQVVTAGVIELWGAETGVGGGSGGH